jgi:acetolactate synthase I/II/III large subunit
MTGAECLLETLVANGVEVCFMNPGTSEMHFVAALDHVPAMRGVLCLYEGVCSGAADGYGRMKGKPAAALLHLGPGLANSLSNFHNARKARTPVVSIVGEHSTKHLTVDAPLSSDIAAFARTVSTEVRTVASSATLGQSASDTIAAALALPGQVAMLIVPADYSWLQTGTGAGPVVVAPERAFPCTKALDDAAVILKSGNAVSIVLGGTAVNPRALAAAGRLAATFPNLRVFADRSASRLASGRGLFDAPKVPYFPEDAAAAQAGLTNMLLVEAKKPVSFFGYPNTPSSPVPDSCAVSILAALEEDGTGALESLVNKCGAQNAALVVSPAATTPAPIDGPLTLDSIGQTLAALMPENSIVSDEMVSSAAGVLAHLVNAPIHDQLPVTGGSIGQGLPVAVGAAIACPDRKVIALEGDGSAMYSYQSLWTMARENLDVVVVMFANHRYRILDIEMKRTGARGVGEKANNMLDLERPDLDFVSLARGLGVPATRATTAAEFTAQFEAAVKQRGPCLIEVVL